MLTSNIVDLTDTEFGKQCTEGKISGSFYNYKGALLFKSQQ